MNAMTKKRWFNASWFYATWLQFLIRYRRTALGPVWLLIGPALFILVLGKLYAHIGAHSGARFVPFLAVGLIAWTPISGFVTASSTVFQRNRAQVLQGNVGLLDIVIIDVFSTVLTFAHQTLILIGVFLYYGVTLTPYALVSLVGLFLIITSGIWLSTVFGIIGARYRDLFEIIQAVMRIAFLATPILWMPGQAGRGGMLGAFLVFNPFYHFLEIVRAPLLGQPISPLSWAVVIVINLVGFVLAYYFYKRFARFVPLWV